MFECQAAVTDGNGKFSIETIVVAEPQRDEVVMQIKTAGVYHTDWDSQTWGKSLIFRHEGAGIIVKLGDSVKSLEIGDLVTLNWAILCYERFQCRKGN